MYGYHSTTGIKVSRRDLHLFLAVRVLAAALELLSVR